MGANLRTLVRVLRASGPIPASSVPHCALALLVSILRSPFSLWERKRVESLTRGGIAAPDPVFIVGHWRSGTTHLYSLLARSPEFAYVPPLAVGMPWDFLTLGAALRPILERALPADRFIDRMAVDPDSPQEDEIALASMQTLSYYHGIYFPHRFSEHFKAGIFFDGCDEGQISDWQAMARLFLGKVALQQPGRRLLIKNPVYTTRIDMLREMWPNARFIHIHRNPYIVFRSTRNFYRALFRELALQASDKVDLDTVILEAYPRMMQRLDHDSARLPQAHYVELSFDELEARPLETAERIYDALGLSGFEAARSDMESYVNATRDYRKNTYRFTAEDNRLVEKHWGDYIRKWGYEVPT